MYNVPTGCCYQLVWAFQFGATMGRFQDLSGQKFGHYKVLGEHRRKNGKTQWLCRCEKCGRVKWVGAYDLKSGNSKGCRSCHSTEANTTHGKYGTRLYNVWHKAKQRCYYPNDKRYEIYGGRGIKMCPEWKNDFQAFHDWAMANGYEPDAPYGKCTIDRIDVNGPYAPWNCRWVDMKVQRSNQRGNSA